MLLIITEGEQRFAQGNGLARGGIRRFLRCFDHVGAQSPGHFRRPVRTVVRDHIKIVQFPGIIHILQIPDNISDDLLLIMGGNQHQEAGFRIIVRIILCLLPEAKKTHYHLVDHGAHQQHPGYSGDHFQDRFEKRHGCSILLRRGARPSIP